MPLVDTASGGDLLDRIGGLRRSLAHELGFIIPAVHIKDDLTLQPAEYRLLLKGELVGQGELLSDKLLAIDPGVVNADILEIPTHEPAFGLPALWIEDLRRDEAELAGYTVVEPSAVLATHLAELSDEESNQGAGFLRFSSLQNPARARTRAPSLRRPPAFERGVPASQTDFGACILNS